MKNPSGNKLEKLMFRLFDQMVEGSDKYITKQGSTWLIFTEEKKWITEFTESGTLWFNYNSFQSELELGIEPNPDFTLSSIASPPTTEEVGDK